MFLDSRLNMFKMFFSGCGYNRKPKLGRLTHEFARNKTANAKFECHAKSKRRNTIGKRILEKLFSMIDSRIKYAQNVVLWLCVQWQAKYLVG
jgi:hypothetical protein